MPNCYANTCRTLQLIVSRQRHPHPHPHQRERTSKGKGTTATGTALSSLMLARDTSHSNIPRDTQSLPTRRRHIADDSIALRLEAFQKPHSKKKLGWVVPSFIPGNKSTLNTYVAMQRLWETFKFQEINFYFTWNQHVLLKLVPFKKIKFSGLFILSFYKNYILNMDF